MSPRERAEKAYPIQPEGMGNAEYESMMNWLTDVITAAVEEEREACAQIADSHDQTEMEAGQESNKRGAGLSGLGHAFAGVAAKEIAKAIRARSQSKGD